MRELALAAYGSMEAVRRLYLESPELFNHYYQQLNGLLMDEHQEGKRHFLKVGLLAVGALVLTACGGGTTETPAPTKLPKKPSTEPIVVLKATATPTEAPKPTPTELSIGFAEGGEYSQELKARIAAGVFVAEEGKLGEAVDKWGEAKNRPFLPGSNQLNYVHIEDLFNPIKPEDTPEQVNAKVAVVLQASGYDPSQGDLFYLPVKNGKFLQPEQLELNSEGDIPPGYGPLRLTRSQPEAGTYLTKRKDLLIQAEAKNGEVKNRLDVNGNWEPATLGLNPQNLIQVTDWDRQPMTPERMKELAGKTDTELLAAAPVVEAKFFHSDRPEITALTPAEVTRLDGGVTLVRYDTNIDKTVGSKTMKEPGLWWQVGAGTVATEINPGLLAPLVEKFGTIKDNQYVFSGNNFVDWHTGAVMAKNQNGWTGTSPEERYTHLIQEEEKAKPRDQSVPASNTAWVVFGCYSTGNSQWIPGELRGPNAGEQLSVDYLRGEVVFRDPTGKFQYLEVNHTLVVNRPEDQDPQIISLNIGGQKCMGLRLSPFGIGCDGPKSIRLYGSGNKELCRAMYSIPGQSIGLSIFTRVGIDPYYYLRQNSEEARYNTPYKGAASCSEYLKNKAVIDEMVQKLKSESELSIPLGLIVTPFESSVMISQADYEKLLEEQKQIKGSGG